MNIISMPFTRNNLYVREHTCEKGIVLQLQLPLKKTHLVIGKKSSGDRVAVSCITILTNLFSYILYIFWGSLSVIAASLTPDIEPEKSSYDS